MLRRGAFYRNQNKAGHRFGDPNCGPSFAPKPEDWGWADAEGQAGLSVNIASCPPEPHCSTCLHPNSAQFKFVIRIDLHELSKATRIPLIAKYTPIPPPEEEHENPCHFDILPVADNLDDALQSVRHALRKLHDEPSKKPKSDPADIEAAKRRKASLDAIFTVLEAPAHLKTCASDLAKPTEQSAE